MLGFRGASRYYAPRYREGFALECRAMRRLREEMGFTQCDRDDSILPHRSRKPTGCWRSWRTMDWCAAQDGLEMYVMCEIPSNVILAERIRERVRRIFHRQQRSHATDAGRGSRFGECSRKLFDERDEAVKWMIAQRDRRTRIRPARKVGLCGQAPSDHPEFAEFLVAQRHRFHIREPGQLSRSQARRGQGGTDALGRADRSSLRLDIGGEFDDFSRHFGLPHPVFAQGQIVQHRADAVARPRHRTHSGLVLGREGLQ